MPAAVLVTDFFLRVGFRTADFFALAFGFAFFASASAACSRSLWKALHYF
ncbi:MAG TPA: hypothetical protein VN442_24095 [Bryobacteraceae bacterium]|nr:hypothetical protein [Bryobacteraceae bacterium]